MKKLLVYGFAIFGAIFFPLLLISAFNNQGPKIVYQDRVVLQIQYVNMNIVLHGNSINTVVAKLHDYAPSEYAKIVWFYNSYILREGVNDPTLAPLIIEKAIKYDVALDFAFATVYQESKFRVQAYHYNKATKYRPESWDFGLGQLNTESHPKWKKADFFNAEKNLDQTMKELKELLVTNNSDLNYTLVGYNAGKYSLGYGKIPLSTALYIFIIRDYEKVLDIEFCKHLIPMLSTRGIDFSKLD